MICQCQSLRRTHRKLQGTFHHEKSPGSKELINEQESPDFQVNNLKKLDLNRLKTQY